MNSNNITQMTVDEAIEHLTWYKNTHLSGFGKTYWAISCLIAAAKRNSGK